MRSFILSDRTVATAATANHAGAQLWNPSSARSLFVTQIAWAKTVGTVDGLGLVRSSARGTPGTSLTVVAQDDADADAAAPSGAILDKSVFTVQPTLVSGTAYMFRWNLPATIGSGFIVPMPDPIRVPPGQGLVLVTLGNVILQPADATFWWRE